MRRLNGKKMDKALVSYCVLTVLALGLSIAGVYVLAGKGWAMIGAGVGLALLSEVLRRGMASEATDIGDSGMTANPIPQPGVRSE